MNSSKTILKKLTARNKRMPVFALLFLLLAITQSAQSATIVDLEGDKDGFGVGCPIVTGLHFTDYGQVLADYREPSDPNFTDTWVGEDQTWTHTYNLGGFTPLSASLEIFVACIADNPGWNADVRVNGVSVGTIPQLTSDYDITRVLTFNVPVGLLNSPDGITIDLNNDLDGYIIDYSQLSIEIGSSGTPANDNCSNAAFVGNVTNLAFSTVGATHDGIGACMTSPNIWYKYTATCTGSATFSLCGSSFDTIMAVYSGTSCTNLTIPPLGCNDDADCGQQSKLTINVTSGKTYWVEVGGFDNVTGAGKLTISCGGQVQTASDLGDAPDNTNHFPSSNMRTYDHQAPAKFPTVYQGNVIVGPIHLNPKTVAYIGETVTYEDEADQGYDQDATNNLIPSQLNVNADKDGGDDGVVMHSDPFLGKTFGMTHCQLSSFDYKVNVIDPNVDMYVNVWFDWNRDGDWNDSGLTDAQLNCSSCDTSGIVNEWAVQNVLLFDLNAGINTLTTPGFLAWYPASGDKKIWMRITLSDQPFKGGTGAAGSGPANGYDYGETEDYYFTPSEDCSDCIDWDRNGTLDENDLYTYMINYMWNWLNNCANN